MVLILRVKSDVEVIRWSRQGRVFYRYGSDVYHALVVWDCRYDLCRFKEGCYRRTLYICPLRRYITRSERVRVNIACARKYGRGYVTYRHGDIEYEALTSRECVT